MRRESGGRREQTSQSLYALRLLRQLRWTDEGGEREREREREGGREGGRQRERGGREREREREEERERLIHNSLAQITGISLSLSSSRQPQVSGIAVKSGWCQKQQTDWTPQLTF